MTATKRHMHVGRWLTLGGLCLLGLSQGGQASAGALRILPVRIEVAPSKQFCSMSISNDGSAPTIVQIRGYGWTRDRDGTDRLNPATGPAVNPSIVSIPAGQSRLVRCSLPDRPGPIEQSYRLIIDELPAPRVAPGTVQTLLQISVPVFRAPAGAAAALHWSISGDRLVITNQGNRHSHVVAIILWGKAPKAKPVRMARGFYLLAGGRIDVPLPKTPDGGVAAVEFETVQGSQTASPALPGRVAD